jgi:cbb3-type cytochrome oxidase subunit 1
VFELDGTLTYVPLETVTANYANGWMRAIGGNAIFNRNSSTVILFKL